MNACGVELSEGAVVPESIADLFEHVAFNMVAHAHWVGCTSEPCAAEQAGLLQIAEHYRAAAKEARTAAAVMRSMLNLEPASHDVGALDRTEFSAWMLRKVALQRRLAKLLLVHAEHSQTVLDAQ